MAEGVKGYPSVYGAIWIGIGYSRVVFERGPQSMAQQDVVVSCEHLLARADSMLEASMKLIDQARPEDAREQISGAHSALTEAIGILQALLL